MRITIFILSFCFLVSGLRAQVTYAENIAEIIYSKCSSCHRPGEIGPFAMTNYDEVKSWGPMIEFVTTNNIMPPWKADPNYSHFIGENVLTEDQVNDISEWVENGMPRGDENVEPEFPDFPDGSVLGTPDLVLEMAEDWIHEGNYQDNYRYFVLPSGLTEDKIVKAVEFRPGNSKIVHHALIFEDVTGEAAAKDNATPEYGFNGFGSFLEDEDDILEQKQFPGYVPGQKPILYPDGIGQILRAGADVVVQIHYAPWPVDESDRSSLNIFFMDENEEDFERELDNHIMVPQPGVLDQPFFIPANETRLFHGQYTIPIDVSLVNIAPHMHLLGTNWEVYLEKPDGDTTNLIRVNEWDFNWQGTYNFDRFIVAPAGTVVHAFAGYDNTVNNPNNPNDPPQFVTWGEGTQDEMYYLPIGFVEYREGDEDVIFTDNTTAINEVDEHGNIFYSIQPNPVNYYSIIKFRLSQGKSLDIDIFDLNGNHIRSLRDNEFFNTGTHHIDFNANNLSSGIYLIQIRGEKTRLTQKFVKAN